MIRTKNLVPEVYYKESRDFQLLGRIYDFLFNYLKTNLDAIENNPYSENFDLSLVSLLSSTLGFKQTHEYNTKQLMALCSIFMLALKNKGNIQSIEYLLNLLANVENIPDQFETSIDIDNPYLLYVYIPLTVKDTTLFEDVLNYVLPAGMSYSIVSQLLYKADLIADKYKYNKDEKAKNFVSKNLISAGITKDTQHSAKTGQLLQMDEAELPTPSDVEVGRIDDITVIRVNDSYIDSVLADTVKENQESTYAYKIIFGLNGGTGNPIEVISYDNNSCIVKLPACPYSYEGKIFDYWEVDGATKDPGDEVTLTSTSQVQAVWKQS